MVKGMLKRALSLFLTLFLVIGFLPAATVSAATETVGGMLADPFIGFYGRQLRELDCRWDGDKRRGHGK